MTTARILDNYRLMVPFFQRAKWDGDRDVENIVRQIASKEEFEKWMKQREEEIEKERLQSIRLAARQ